MQVFGPLLIGGLAFITGLVVRSQEPSDSWLRSGHWLLKLTAVALGAAFIALLVLAPSVSMETTR